MVHNKMKLLVGLFMIFIFLTLSAFIYFVLKEKGAFDKRHTYYFTTTSADYFHVGMPLKFSGFKIGEIDDISLKDDGTVNMSFSVKKENRKWMSQGSILMIIKPLIGASHIELFTSLGSEPLQDGSYMKLVMSDSINDLIIKLQPAVTKSVEILNNVHTITSYLSSEDSELKKILKNLEKLTAKLANDDSLLTSATGDKNATQNIITSINETAKTMQNITQITSSLNQKIIDPASTSINEINKILVDINQKLDALDPAIKAAGTFDNELIQIKEDISVGLQKSNQLMDKVDALMQDESQSEVSLP